MTAGDMYTIAGSATGTTGTEGRRRQGQRDAAVRPFGIAVDSAGNVYIADSGNNRVQEMAAAAHTQLGQQMTAGDIYTVAGGNRGARGATPATAAPPPARC